ncbi:MAG: transposase [Chloroflexota bacterium]|nr:MAG: transposase [Chloroflexota bacterium]
MPYIKLYYHFVWATAKREPFITPEVEPALHRYLTQKVHEQKAYLHIVNGMPDHIHLIASLPPTLRVSDFVQILKGGSSHFVSTELQIPFAWQKGYSAFTISEPNLPKAIEYVLHQKTHHATGTTFAVYEPDDAPTDET